MNQTFQVAQTSKRTKKEVTDALARISSTAETAEEQWGSLKIEVKKELSTLEAKVSEEVKSLIEKASSPNLIIKSDSIHVCVFNMSKEYVTLLLNFLPNPEDRARAINHRDSGGQTPLMVCAVSAPSSRQKQLEMLEFLLECGAMKDLTNPLGLTALGVFRQAQRDRQDFETCFGFELCQDEMVDALVDQIERLLTPATGPTAADDQVLDYESDGSMDDDEGDY